MKIALLSDGIFPHVIGGIQKHSYYLCKYMAQNGVAVDLYHRAGKTQQNDDTLALFSPEEQTYIRSFPVQKPPIWRFPGHYVYQSYRFSREIFHHFLEQSPEVDLIYAQGFTGWRFVQARKKEQFKIPIIVNFHGLEMYQQAANAKSRLQKLYFQWPADYNLRHADYAVSLGGKLTDILRKRKLPDTRILEMPIGLDRDWLTPQLNPTQEKRRFVFVGRYERRKGVEELDQVLKRLLMEYDFEMHFIGPIPDQLHIQHPNVTYWGMIRQQEQMRSILRKQDVLVCPSHSEGMPTVILEAMASGLAIIASDVGAVQMQVDDRNGWKIQAGNTDELYQAMVKVIDIPTQELDAKKQAAFAKLQNTFLWERIAEHSIQVFQDILKI